MAHQKFQNLVCSLFHPDAIMEIKNHDAICSCPNGPVSSGIIYLHSMASKRINEDFNKHLEPFVNICHTCGHKPTSVLLVSTLWYDENETEMYKKTTELEERFQKAAGSAIRSIPYSVRFDGGHDQLSAYNAIDLLVLDMMQQDA